MLIEKINDSVTRSILIHKTICETEDVGPLCAWMEMQEYFCMANLVSSKPLGELLFSNFEG